jgi:hypothetical protein
MNKIQLFSIKQQASLRLGDNKRPLLPGIKLKQNPTFNCTAATKKKRPFLSSPFLIQAYSKTAIDYISLLYPFHQKYNPFQAALVLLLSEVL